MVANSVILPLSCCTIVNDTIFTAEVSKVSVISVSCNAPRLTLSKPAIVCVEKNSVEVCVNTEVYEKAEVQKPLPATKGVLSCVQCQVNDQCEKVDVNVISNEVEPVISNDDAEIDLCEKVDVYG